MKLRLLLLCSNSESSIYRTLKTWSFVDSIDIHLNNTTDRTRSEVLLADMRACIHELEFKDFSSARNELIEIVSNKYPEGTNDYYIYIDDSYEFVGDPTAFIREVTGSASEVIAITVESSGLSYPRSLIFKRWVRFVGTVHETINRPATGRVKESRIYDRVYQDHTSRTKRRNKKDLESLGNSIREQFYKAGLSNDFEGFIERCPDAPEEYLFMAYMSIGQELLAIKACPRLSAGPLFTLYQLTGNIEYLKFAHVTCLKIPDTIVPIDEKIYTPIGKINVCFMKWKVFEELRNSRLKRL